MGLPLLFGTYFFDGDADQHALVAFHGAAVVVPVRVLTRNPAVVLDESFHGVGQWHDRRAALDQEPLAVELTGQAAEPDARVASEVLHLERRLAAADDGVALVVDADGDRRHGRLAALAQGADHDVVVLAEALAGLVGGHKTPSTPPRSGPPIDPE